MGTKKVNKPVRNPTRKVNKQVQKPSVKNVSSRAKKLLEKQKRVLRDDSFVMRDLAGIQKGQQKMGHYSWWVFPTEFVTRGSPETGVTSLDDAKFILANDTTRVQWIKFLEGFCDACEKFGKGNPSGHARHVLGGIDYGKAKFFWKFWLGRKIRGIERATKSYPEFHKQIKRVENICR